MKCPEGHTDTYQYDDSHFGYGLLLMCNICEDFYKLEKE